VEESPVEGEIAMNNTAMTEPKITIASDVHSLLKERNAESEFAGILDLIRKCFPQALSLDGYLQEDCTEPTWIRVVIDVYFSAKAADTEQFLRQWREFDQRLAELVPIEYPPLFLVMRRYSVS
jgi:hypothetical protein